MEKEEKNKKVDSQQQAPRPKRDAYKQMFNEDYPDLDFEDKEARYERMAQDRSTLRSYRKSGEALNNVFEQNRWLAAMVQDIATNPDTNPIEWMADNGIDINEVMTDEKARKKVIDKISAFQQKQLEDEQENEQRQQNFQKSAKALQALGLSEEQNMQMWSDFYTNIVDPALRGEVSEDTWRMIQKANNYDNDIAQAREQSAMQARNEKIKNSVKQFDTPMPPTLSQQGAQRANPQKPKSRYQEYRDIMKQAGY